MGSNFSNPDDVDYRAITATFVAGNLVYSNETNRTFILDNVSKRTQLDYKCKFRTSLLVSERISVMLTVNMFPSQTKTRPSKTKCLALLGPASNNSVGSQLPTGSIPDS